MGRCWVCMQVTAVVVVAFAAILGYFHLECQNSNQQKQYKKEDFRPEVTNVENYPLMFSNTTEVSEMSIDIGYVLVQALPCCVTSLLKAFGLFKWKGGASSYAKANVTFLDARKSSPGSFHDTGFTLVTLDQEPVTTDWRTSGFKENADVKHFQKEMEPHIRKLFPDVKRIVWTYNVVRGGNRLGDQPRAVDAPHLDYHQNDTARVDFHQRFPVSTKEQLSPRVLLGELDQEDDEMRVLLGVWKPIRPNALVCDHPLAIMDARTFKPERLAMMELHIDFGFLTIHNLNGNILHDSAQKWYYYPFQTTREVLVFTQYSRGKFFANPHTSFTNPNCPADREPRISVELRVALFFPRASQ